MHVAPKAASLLLIAFAALSGAAAQCRGLAPRGGSCGASSGLCCPSGQCCSSFGFCGETPGHCGANCQRGFGRCSGGGNGPTPTPGPTGPQPQPQPQPQPPSQPQGGALLSLQQWDAMFPNRNNPQCHGARNSFYSHDAFLRAAATFPAFAKSSDATTNKRELAAFLAHIAHETGGLCWIVEGGAGGLPASNYCQPGQYPCALGKSYHGRGPIQLSWNYNYDQAGKALNFDGINNPDAVAQDPVLAFKTALWFWMTPQSPKPSAHDVMAGRWAPSAADRAAGRTPGFGMVINIINGGLECGKGAPSDKETTRINYYNQMASALGVSPDPNTSCASMRTYS